MFSIQAGDDTANSLVLGSIVGRGEACGDAEPTKVIEPMELSLVELPIASNISMNNDDIELEAGVGLASGNESADSEDKTQQLNVTAVALPDGTTALVHADGSDSPTSRSETSFISKYLEMIYVILVCTRCSALV